MPSWEVASWAAQKVLSHGSFHLFGHLSELTVSFCSGGFQLGRSDQRSRDGTEQNDTKGTPRWDKVPPYHLTYNTNNKLTGPGSPGPVQDRSRSRGRRLSRAAGVRLGSPQSLPERSKTLQKNDPTIVPHDERHKGGGCRTSKLPAIRTARAQRHRRCGVQLRSLGVPGASLGVRDADFVIAPDPPSRPLFTGGNPTGSAHSVERMQSK